jgi:hypothetical protein
MMNRAQAAAPPVPGPGVGWIMARLDSPYPHRTLRPSAMIAVLVAVIVLGAFVLLQHQAADVAFHEYALKTSFVDISSLATNPAQYRGQLVHTRGQTGDVILTDAGKQVTVSLPGATVGTGSAGPEILVLTGAEVPSHTLVDIWGTCAGTVPLDGGAKQGSMTVVRADYVKAVQ